jgi:ribonuclease R
MNIDNEEFRFKKIIKSAKDGITREEILSKFSDEKKDFIDFILTVELDKYDVIELDGKYIHIDNTNYRVGTYKEKKYNNRFVEIGKNFYNPNIDTPAINGDRVLVKIVDKKAKTCVIEKVLSRELKSIYGEVIMIKNDYFLLPDNPKYKKLTINLNKNDEIIVGSKVVVELNDEVEDNKYNGTITGLIGYSSDPGIDILMEACKYRIDSAFPKECIEQAETLPLEVRDIDKIGRCDLTQKEIFTIDGDDTKDIDDAISLDVLDNGNYLLGVHITDVTHYIDKNSPLDQEAYHRGTSSYLASKVIPMYPPIISNGIGSLNPNVDRLTLTCEMEIDANGNIIRKNVYPSIINSKIQMTYKKVNDILDNNSVDENYRSFVPTLRRMRKLSLRLFKKRLIRGAMDLDNSELKIELDEKGFPKNFYVREPGTGENLIEEFMIAANEAVAELLQDGNYPAMYRIHEEPSREKIKDFIECLNKAGIQCTFNESGNLQMEIQKIVKYLSKYDEIGKMMAYPLIRTLRKARYSPDNLGHFGLASEGYVHFTSPIRRYPDDTIHRAIKKYIFNKDHEEDEDEQEKDYLELEKEAEYLSEREKLAEKCERAINSMKCAEYMEEHIGNVYYGRISQIDNSGITVQLDNLIEGRVKINTLPCHYEYNEETMSLVALDDAYEDYYYGDLLQVEVANASKENKTIEFEILKVVEQNKYIKHGINESKRLEVMTKSLRKNKRQDKRRAKWNI